MKGYVAVRVVDGRIAVYLLYISLCGVFYKDCNLSCIAINSVASASFLAALALSSAAAAAC